MVWRYSTTRCQCLPARVILCDTSLIRGGFDLLSLLVGSKSLPSSAQQGVSHICQHNYTVALYVTIISLSLSLSVLMCSRCLCQYYFCTSSDPKTRSPMENTEGASVSGEIKHLQ